MSQHDRALSIFRVAGDGTSARAQETVCHGPRKTALVLGLREIQGEQTTVLELRVSPEDLGKVIGKQGRTARSIRTLLGAAGMKLNRRFTLEILE